MCKRIFKVHGIIEIRNKKWHDNKKEWEKREVRIEKRRKCNYTNTIPLWFMRNVDMCCLYHLSVQERCDGQCGFLLLSFPWALSDLYCVSNLQAETCDLISLYFMSLTYVFRIILVLTLQCGDVNYISYLQSNENSMLFHSFSFWCQFLPFFHFTCIFQIRFYGISFPKLYHCNYVSVFQNWMKSNIFCLWLCLDIWALLEK